MSTSGHATFFGRSQELGALQHHLDAVGSSGAGRLLSVRGRRQVGKSRLVSEFVTRAGRPQLFVTGSLQSTPAADLESFQQDARLNCTLPGADLLTGPLFGTWEQALGAVRGALPANGPSIVVLDELPWLLRRDPGLEGTSQKLWDRRFESAPVLMILIGSDLAVMQMLTDHARPLFGRAKEMVIRPLSVHDTARMAGIDETEDAPAAFDATLMTGGYPRLVQEWRRHRTLDNFLATQLSDENTEVVTTGQRILEAEFPADLQAGIVLRAAIPTYGSGCVSSNRASPTSDGDAPTWRCGASPVTGPTTAGGLSNPWFAAGVALNQRCAIEGRRRGGSRERWPRGCNRSPAAPARAAAPPARAAG